MGSGTDQRSARQSNRPPGGSAVRDALDEVLSALPADTRRSLT